MNYLVTGASRGIGAELVRQLVARGHQVIALVREPERASVPAGVEVLRCALDRVGDLLHLHTQLADRELDVLINNAGVLGKWTSLAEVDLDDARATFDVNVLGALGVTQAALASLRRRATRRIVAISSGMGSIRDNTDGGAYGYRMSKAALNMAVRSMAVDLAAERFTCVTMNPGWVQTQMGGAGAPVPVEVSARNILARIDALTPADNGKFLDHVGGELPW
jgi:NAD(P)-dependent dehydrogenase (short-subunit alcohol dehydrogenase family)